MQYLFAYHFSTLANHGRARTYRPLCYSWRQMTSYGMGRWKGVCYWCNVLVDTINIRMKGLSEIRNKN